MNVIYHNKEKEGTRLNKNKDKYRKLWFDHLKNPKDLMMKEERGVPEENSPGREKE